MADVEGFQRHFESVFKALLLASKGAFAMLEFAEREFLGEPMVWHANYMACPAQLGLHQEGMDTGKVDLG